MMQTITYSDYNKTPFLLDWLSDSDIATRLVANDKQLQELETALFYTLDYFWIDDATGYQLDIFGKLVGISRSGYDDLSYRSLLKLQANINVIAGSPESVISTVRILIGNDNFKYEHSYPAKVVITTEEQFQIYVYYYFRLMSGDRLTLMSGDPLVLKEKGANEIGLLESVVPAGVEVEIINAPI